MGRTVSGLAGGFIFGLQEVIKSGLPFNQNFYQKDSEGWLLTM